MRKFMNAFREIIILQPCLGRIDRKSEMHPSLFQREIEEMSNEVPSSFESIWSNLVQQFETAKYNKAIIARNSLKQAITYPNNFRFVERVSESFKKNEIR